MAASGEKLVYSVLICIVCTAPKLGQFSLCIAPLKWGRGRGSDDGSDIGSLRGCPSAGFPVPAGLFVVQAVSSRLESLAVASILGSAGGRGKGGAPLVAFRGRDASHWASIPVS